MTAVEVSRGPRPRTPFRRWSVLPGFGPTLGFTLTYLSLIVLIPLLALFLKAAQMDLPSIWHILTNPRVLAAFRLTFLASAVAALVNVAFGLVIAWMLVRYRFWGRRVVDALVDLPFALPTAVAGVALSSLMAKNGWVGSLFAPLGIDIAYAPPGIVMALIFVGLPFVVRTVQPVLQDFEPELEEAAATLGADRWTTFIRVTLPALAPAMLTGFALAFARAIGEYGSVIFIAGNRPGLTEIVPLLIVIKLEEFDYRGASVIAVASLLVSFTLLILINFLQRRLARHHERG
ncbi:MAG TPA: sulfate ABC transporter permease subunit CysT [Alphaproteobacteria bacterium]|jgi:sulfate transport system permease protein|nr:sulfate ABC transporter permease subunit CysT [Alphaproteobacteria bacterium]